MNKKQFKLECSSCGRGLISMLLPEDNDRAEAAYYVSANCAFCGDESYKQKISRDMSWSPYSDKVQVLDIMQEENGVRFLLGAKS